MLSPAFRRKAPRFLVEVSFLRFKPQTIRDIEFTLLPTENLSVPAGKFAETLHLRKRMPGYTLDLWFGRGGGLLKSVCAETGVTEELSNYHLSKLTPPAP